jgi:hypothetical protein
VIGKRAPLGTGFAGLQQYLLHGRNGAAPHRSVWTTTRNLPDPDPEKAAAVMRATANASARTEKPVYHLSVSLAPGERLERAELERVADRLLQDLGLADHQALIAEHADGAQQHIHLMVNRVHPDTGRAWVGSHDYHRIETSLREQERELGLRIVPGRHSPVPGHDRYLGTRPGRGQFVENVRELAGESFREAKGWQELHASLSQKGLTLQPSRAGRGLVITDGRRYVAASRVERGMSRPRMEARLGTFEPASPDLRRIQEISRQLMSRGRLEAMRGRYQGSLARLGRAIGNHERAGERLSQASRQLDAALGRVYRDPAAARQRIEATLERHGAGETVRAVSERPAGAGKLHGRVALRARTEAREALRERVPRAIRSYASARQAERAALQRLKPFRRNPKHPVLEAASRARAVLGRALRRLESLDGRYSPEKVLRAQAVSVVRRLGWRAVSVLLPGPAFNALRVTVALAKAPARAIGRGMGLGIER